MLLDVEGRGQPFYTLLIYIVRGHFPEDSKSTAISPGLLRRLGPRAEASVASYYSVEGGNVKLWSGGFLCSAECCSIDGVDLKL